MKRTTWTIVCLLLVAAGGQFTLAGERELEERLEKRRHEIGRAGEKLEDLSAKMKRLKEEGADRKHIEELGRIIGQIEHEVGRREEEVRHLEQEIQGGEREHERVHAEGRERPEHERAERGEHAMRQQREREEMENDEEHVPPEEAMRFVQEHCPYFARELHRMREQQPEAFEEHMEEAMDKVSEFRELRRHNPEAAELFLHRHKLEDRSHGLAEEIAHTDNPEKRAHLQQELAKILNETFEVMMRMGKMEIENMKQEIEEIARVLEKKHRARDRIIERRMRDLVREHGEEEDEDVLGWW